MIPSISRFHLLVPLLLMFGMAGAARAQSNFSFWLGGTGLYFDDTPINWGTSVGTTAKFNVLSHLLLRAQFNVDRVQLKDLELSDFTGTQTNTYVSVGFGGEFAMGTRDFNVFAHVTPHGSIRTVSRILPLDDGGEHLWTLRRFSLGVNFGLGFEAYLTDNIGFEMQAQYDIFNLDHSDVDPVARGLRSLVGVQFYLGRNFAR